MEKPTHLYVRTYRHERSGECWWERGAGQRGIKRRKRDNFNSIINKIYLKKRTCMIHPILPYKLAQIKTQ